MDTERANIRSPGVSGMFYPSEGRPLTALIENFHREVKSKISPEPVSGTIIGGIVPHAGIEYCGRHAVHFFDRVKNSGFPFETVIIMHPNHYGSGPALSADDHQGWEVSNGIIEADLDFAEELNLPFSAAAQKREHSAEVIVPYILHFLSGNLRLVSINMLDQSYGAAKDVAVRICSAVQKLKRKVLVIASSDFTHFESRTVAKGLDDIVLQEITTRNARGVSRAVRENNLSVCGYGPIMALMEYSAMVDPEYRVKILSRGDSGDISNTSDVVSYISALFSEHH